jgi:anthranilate phosphoribosyltransferase
MKQLLLHLLAGRPLDRAEATEAMRLMLRGQGTPEQIASALTLLHARGETVEEMTGFLEGLREAMIPVPATSPDLFDTCGTGGDGAQTFNISTAAALVLAATGVKVAKHGNRSVSSRCGSADVIEALGIPLIRDPQAASARIDGHGFGFLFAPYFHPALAQVGPIRRGLGVPTVFNFLGPLANPAPVRRKILGIYDGTRLGVFADLLRESGTIAAMVVSAEDGLDEFSLSAPTRVLQLEHGVTCTFTLSPEDFGLPRAPRESYSGGDAAENARLIERILAGQEQGPRRDIVLMNAGAALVVAGLVKGPREGVALARQAIDEGRASRVLQRAREAA